MPVSKKKKAWNAKYDKRTYSQVTLKIRKADKEIIDNAAAKCGVMTGTFCKKCVEYCVKNDIQLFSDEQRLN